MAHRKFLGTAVGCGCMAAFLAAQTPEMRAWYRERMERSPRFYPCPKHRGFFVVKRDSCDYCMNAKRD